MLKGLLASNLQGMKKIRQQSYSNEELDNIVNKLIDVQLDKHIHIRKDMSTHKSDDHQQEEEEVVMKVNPIDYHRCKPWINNDLYNLVNMYQTLKNVASDIKSGLEFVSLSKNALGPKIGMLHFP